MATVLAPAVARKKSGWLRKTVIALLAFVVVLGVVFYFRPLTVFGVLMRFSMWRQGIQSRDVQLGSYRIHYLVVGEGRPLVLVHGLGGRGDNWLPLIPQFTAQGFRVYAPDLLGFGDSDKPDVDYSIAMQSGILRQFLDSQGLQQADMAGWSMGGWVSLKFAAENPQRVHRLVLLESPGMKFDAVNAPALLPKTVAELDHMQSILSPHPQTTPAFIAHDVLRLLGAQEWVTRRALLSMGTGKDLMEGKLDGVKMPVLIVYGKQDVLTPPSIGEAMHREMPQSEVALFDNCGHMAPVECSGTVMPRLEQFLK